MSLQNIERVILDVDVGVDDAMALMIFFYAMKLGMVKIEAITCSFGNTGRENVVKNLVRILEATGHTDIPIYRGSLMSIIPPSAPLEAYEGKDGFGDVTWPKEPDTSIVRDTPSSIAMYELVKNNPKQITIVGLAATTNIALAARLYDDFLENVKDIWVVGGNYQGLGNTGTTAEFNFFVDPEAIYLLLNATNKPIHMVPWEACDERASTISLDWRFNVLGKSTVPAMQMITKAERNIHLPPEVQWMCCDGVLAAAYLFQNQTIKEQQAYGVSVELHGADTRGQVAMFLRRVTATNANIIQKIDYDFIKELLLKVGELTDEL